MNILEKTIEDLVYENLKTYEGIVKLKSRGLYNLDMPSQYYRQLNLGSYGIADIIGIKYFRNEEKQKTLSVNVIEIKKDAINYDTLKQAIRYAKGFEDFIGSNFNYEFKFTLIGTSVCKSDFIYFPDVCPNINVYTVSLDLERGIRFKNYSNWSIENPKFPNYDLPLSDVFKEIILNQTAFFLPKSDDLPF